MRYFGAFFASRKPPRSRGPGGWVGGREGPLCFLGEGGQWAVVVTAARVPVPDGKDLVPAGSPRRGLALAGVGLPSRGARCRTDSESSLCTWRFPAF